MIDASLVWLAVLAVLAGACGKRASGGAGSCMDVYECYRACPDATMACTSKCDALGTEAARAANLSLLLCIGAHACKDVSCVTDACGAEMQVCVGAGSAAPSPAPATATNAVSDQDYEFVGANGLTYTPELTIVAHGVQQGLVGTWRESKHNLTFELGDSTYTLRADGAAFGTGGVSEVETGDWKLEAGALSLTPTAMERSATNGMHQENDTITPDGPRTWSIEGVTLEWTTMGTVHEVRRADGLVVAGPGPSWASGPWNWTLRRAK